MKKKLSRRGFLRNGAGAAAVGVTATACGTGGSDSAGLAGPSFIAEGDRAITVVGMDGFEDVSLAGARVWVGEPPSLERTTNDDGTVVVPVGGTTPLRFDTPLDNRCVPFLTIARSATMFPLRLNAFGGAEFLNELHGGVIKRSVRPWHIKCSGELWDDPATQACMTEVVAHLQRVCHGFCTFSVGTGVPRDVSLIDVYEDRTIDAAQFGAIATRQPVGSIVTTGGVVRYSRKEWARNLFLALHEFYHLVCGYVHVTSVKSIMNVSNGPLGMYKLFDLDEDVRSNTAARMAYRRSPGTTFGNGVESDQGIVAPAAVFGGEEVVCGCPPLVHI